MLSAPLILNVECGEECRGGIGDRFRALCGHSLGVKTLQVNEAVYRYHVIGSIISLIAIVM